MRLNLQKEFILLIVSSLLFVLCGCAGKTVINSPYTTQPLTNSYQCSLFGITMNYPADWVVSDDSLNSPEVSMITNVPTDTLLTSYIPSDGAKTVLSDAFYGSNVSVIAPPGQDYIGVAINVGTDSIPTWQPLSVGVIGINSIKDYQCLEDSLSDSLTFATAPPNLQNSVRVYYSINMWSAVVNFQIKNKTYTDFAIAVEYLPQTFEEWSQNLINSSGVLTSQQTQLSGYSAYEITFKGKDLGDNKQYEGLRAWALINGKIYDINAMVEEPYQYSDYSAIFFQMINSIHISQ